LADLGQVLVGRASLRAVVIDADDIEVVPVDALERQGAVADRAAVDRGSAAAATSVR
jgi:hypothetical protein